MFRKTRKVVVSIAVGAVVSMSFSGQALAGEWTGNDRSLKNPDGTLNGRSACAFSGQNDEWSPEMGDVPGVDDFFRTQSFGQVPKAFRPPPGSDFHPGRACNPNIGEPAH